MKLYIVLIVVIPNILCATFLKLPTTKNKSSTLESTASWPKMKNYDIWGTNIKNKQKQYVNKNNNNNNNNNNNYNKLYGENDDSHWIGNGQKNQIIPRNGKVLNFFPIPVDDDECLSNDGRRSGACLNVYECRIQGGTGKGRCALGFGVCCVFTATCEQEVHNNITYIISPNFPALMPNDIKSCKLKIKMIDPDITQLRLDFLHFNLGQPNRRTGICDGDILKLTGGTAPEFIICGQNSGQHMYYDVNAKSREDGIEMLINLSPGFLSPRLWEIRVSQILFGQGSPSGCMQYYSGKTGVIQTFNFAENGRHLANQNYRACVRQESGMCSIAYEPCDERSFRIGQNPYSMYGSSGFNGPPGSFGGAGSFGGVSGENNVPMSASSVQDLAMADNIQNSIMGNDTSAVTADNSTVSDPDAIEGSGGGDDDDGGFFSFGSFFSRPSFFGRSRESRQFFPTCSDRITLPCIIEDFIGAGMGSVPGCQPIHCGNTLCAPGQVPCRIETSVTPFGLGIHFGDGVDKGSPEDNIGACLRYNQLPCL